MRISDWSSDVCSSDLRTPQRLDLAGHAVAFVGDDALDHREPVLDRSQFGAEMGVFLADQLDALHRLVAGLRSEERRVGNECVSTFISRWSPDDSNKNNEKNDSIHHDNSQYSEQ